ncbi:GerAB/ArcD/ProY family transporter [Bacillus tuaregi]|uniref:GerAB/ArcD/ProY family transporter n=1 Tax=Bacillus tuaregi TaxID=1816695 RepID=UPI0008F80A7C|nr:endospore germination permease [Bacillus tuaregi]
MKFSRLQMFFVLLLFIGISNHVLIMPHLLTTGQRDAWISALVAYLFLLFWGFLIYLIMKRNQERLRLEDWVKARAGGMVSRFIMAFFIIYVLTISAVSFYDLIQSVNIYFLPETPSFVVMLPFLIICAWAAYSGMKSIIYTSTIILPIVWILGFFVAFFTMEEKDYSYIFPVLTNGYEPVLKGVIIILGGSADLLILLLIQHHMQNTFSYKNLFTLITILVWLILGPTLGVLSSFGPSIAADMRFPAFEQWRLVTLGEYVSHVDFLAVYQLLSGVFIRVSLGLFLLLDSIKTQSKRTKFTLLVVFSLILTIVTTVPTSDVQVQIAIGKVFYPISFICSMFFTFSLFLISYLPMKRGIQDQ